MPDAPPPYAVLLADEASLKPMELARALAAARKVPALDLAPLMRRSWGILAEDVSKADAERTAADLASAGFKTLPVPAGLLEEVPSPLPVTTIAFSKEGFSHAERQAPPGHAPWSRLALLAAAAWSETTRKASTPPPVEDPRIKFIKTGITLMTGLPTSMGLGRRRPSVEAVIEETDEVFLLDILLKDPSERLRVDARRFDFSCLGARKGVGTAANFKVLIGTLAAAAPGAALNRGARLLPEGRPLRELGYEGAADLERETRWLLTLASLKPAR